MHGGERIDITDPQNVALFAMGVAKSVCAPPFRPWAAPSFRAFEVFFSIAFT